jgi:chemotaxis protein methyltransferase CheR
MTSSQVTSQLADYERFVEQSRHFSSIDLRAYKPGQMERRLRALMVRNKIEGFAEYADTLRRDQAARREFERYVTINVTQFYRDPERFRTLEQELRRTLGHAYRPLLAWSAGCSNGSEPYTVAMMLESVAPGQGHRVYATDIDEDSLRQAKLAGGYTADDLASLPREYRERFTRPGQDHERYSIAPRISAMVEFARHDLIREPYRRGFDLILCRNVVIYFSDETKRTIFTDFFTSLNPGGLLFIGATELLAGAREIGFEQCGHGLYRRPRG